MSESTASLTPMERAALGLTRFVNERPRAKHLAHRFTYGVSKRWVHAVVARRVYTENLAWLARSDPDRGIVLIANHRSFFDMYIIMLALVEHGAAWLERTYFPVRSNFFYEHPLGLAVNMMIGGGCMYPPIFRDSSKAALNKDAVDRVVGFLGRPGTVVGLHPEGTRGKGPDPYQLLPAQPGVGQIVLQAKPMVVPVFINGLPNDFKSGVLDTYRPGARRDNPIIIVAGNELDYTHFTEQKPRASLYKRCSDYMLDAVRPLAERERELRAACSRGEIGDDAPGWLLNRRG